MVCQCHSRLPQNVFSHLRRTVFSGGSGKIYRGGICSSLNITGFKRTTSTDKAPSPLHKRGTDEDTDFTRKVKRCECRGLPIVHHDKYVSELPLNHRFAMRKFHGVLRFLRIDDVISMKQIVEPEQVSASVAGLVHKTGYVENFFTGKIPSDEQRMTGFPWSEGLVMRCRYETGGTILAARLALEHGLACSTGGGTHHAFPDRGSGYCLLNDMAVAAASLIHDGTVQRVLIVDLDVHQGDGTALMFQTNKQVFTFSMHCQQNFPFKKQMSDLDIGLNVGCQDKEYLSHLEEHLPWIVDSFHPDLVLYDAGVDPHGKDELGKLELTDQGLFDRDFFVLRHLITRGIPCATVIGGGYSRDLNALSCRHTIVHRAASKVWKEYLR